MCLSDVWLRFVNGRDVNCKFKVGLELNGEFFIFFLHQNLIYHSKFYASLLNLILIIVNIDFIDF